MGTVNLDFYIHLTDLDRVHEEQGTGQAQRVVRMPPKGPGYAGIFQKVFQPSNTIPAAEELYEAPCLFGSAPFVAPCITSAYFGDETDPPGPGRNIYPDLKEWTIKSGGFLGLPIFQKSTTYKWRGIFKYSPPLNPEGEPAPEDIALIPGRLWVDGFELPTTGETDQTGSDDVSRDASRHADGLGYAWRSLSNSSKGHAPTSLATPINNREVWNRFYMRARRFPTGSAVSFWHCGGGSAASAGINIDLAPDGKFVVFRRTSVNVEHLLGTVGQLVLNQWHKVDILTRYGEGFGTTNAPGTCRIFLDGALIGSFSEPCNGSISTTTGIGIDNTHGTCRLGAVDSQGNDAEIDFDDWIGANWPKTAAQEAAAANAGGSGFTLNGPDWKAGSRCVWLKPRALAVDTADYAGDDWSVLQQVPGIASTGVEEFTSSTSGARLAITTDWIKSVLTRAGSLGPVAWVISAMASLASGGTQGELGWREPGGADDLAAHVPANAPTSITGGSSFIKRLIGSNRVLGGPPDPPSAPNLRPDMELIYQKGASTHASTFRSFSGVVELIGTFGHEDIPVIPGVDPSPEEQARFFGRRHPHNAPYWNSPWVQTDSVPLAPYLVKSGTYVGNDTATELTFRAPVNFLMIRQTGTGTREWVLWWPSMIGPHRDILQFAMPIMMIDATIENALTQAEDEQEFICRIRIAGSNTQNNANGTTYEYIAIMDPAARFLQCGAFAHQTTSELNGAEHALPNGRFLAEAGFFMGELANNSTATESAWFKGPGHAANAVQELDGANPVSPGLEFLQGILKTYTGFHSTTFRYSNAFALWRRDDGSGDPGLPGVLWLTSYVGDGSASRSISFAPVTGLRPLFALVVPGNTTAAIFRDPAHTGTTSQVSTGASNASTGITGGGPDSLSVGSTLNSNGVTYNVFVIPGGPDAGNGGFSTDGEFIPVDPAPDQLDTDEGDEDDFEDDEDPGGGGEEPPPGEVDPPPDLGGDLDENCIAFTTRVANKALAHIGISKPITALDTEATETATQVRTHYVDAVEATLRDFPWPFATKYLGLTLVSGSTGSPVNADWVFAYRRPSDCIFERRIAVEREGAVDPKGPPFMLGHDAGGGLIFTNEASAVLEYTARPTCAAGQGDALFREALSLKLASVLAPALTRIAEKEKNLDLLYRDAIDRAQLVIKPGNPGRRAEVDDEGPDADCPAANVAVVNRALVRIGAQTIANLVDEQSRESQAAALVFEEELQSTLRDFPWSFATAYARNLVLVDGSADAPVSRDWVFSYRLPDNVVEVRRLTTLSGRKFEHSEDFPPMWRLGADDDGKLLFTNLESTADEPIEVEYTARVSCAVAKADPTFRDAFAWRLAATLAPSVAQVNADRVIEQRGRGPRENDERQERAERPTGLNNYRRQVARDAWQMYFSTLPTARVRDANEQQQDPAGDGDVSWIRDRE